MSREAELYKDKIEVSLDGRQIFYLFFGGAVIVGLVFVLGVMVGRRVEARGHVDRARVSATVDPLAALDRLEGTGGLSFQGALRGGDAPASDVEKQIAAMQKADGKPADDKAAAKKPEAAHVEEKAAGDSDEKKTDKAEKSEKSDKVEKAEKSEKSETSDKTDKTDKTEKSEKSEKTEKSGKSEKSDDKKVAKTDDQKPDTKTDTKTDSEKTRYTLQLSSFQDRHEAEAYMDSIKASGYEARVTEASVEGKQYYRVRVGSYRSMDAANAAKADLEKSAKKSAIVTRL